ncbi:MAG: peptidase dimerization domain-containing protein, partial [Clostridia bacterium]|nr:peptidase dimerization domain-containing protein [Clostridia bacterium]
MFTIRLTGQGGHGATPEKCRDAVVAGAALVSELQTVVSRTVSPFTPALLTIGSFHPGTVGNIIAQEAVLRGTLRALDDETAAHLRATMEKIAAGVAAAHGCELSVAYDCRQCAVVNDPALTALAQKCAGELVPPELLGDQKPALLGDDFAQYEKIAPGCYAHVGIADEALGTCAAHHSGVFRVDERALPLGAAWMTLFAQRAAETE